MTVRHQKIALVLERLREVNSLGMVRLGMTGRSSVAWWTSSHWSVSRYFTFARRYVLVARVARHRVVLEDVVAPALVSMFPCLFCRIRHCTGVHAVLVWRCFESSSARLWRALPTYS